MQHPFSLTDRHILITGASSGIGRACALVCDQLGATLTLLGRNEERLQETLQSLAIPEKHQSFSIDLLEYEKVTATVKATVGKSGKLHGLLHCAGISTILPLKVVSVQKMEHFTQTNVFGAYQLTKAVCKPAHLSKEGASIVFLSSVMGSTGEAGRSLYGMTKGALVAAAKSLSVELASKRIRVNCVSPGVVETPMSAKSVYQQDEAALQRVKDMHPLGLGQPEDVANACAFLLSDAAKWITGTDLMVDGGYTAR